MSFKFFYITLVSVCFLAMSCDSSGPEPEPLELPLPRAVVDSTYTLTESGLKFFDFEIGDTTRARADSGDLVIVHYHGWLTDSTIFDSSIIRNNPFEFRIGFGNVIAGWDEGVAGMYLGGERQLVIPPDLAYGDIARPSIPANSTLIFEVILLGTE